MNLWGSSSFIQHFRASPCRISFDSTTISMHRLLPPALPVACLSAFFSCFPSRIGDFCLPFPPFVFNLSMLTFFILPSLRHKGVKCDGQFLADLLLGTASRALGEAHEAAAREHFGEQPPLISHLARQFVKENASAQSLFKIMSMWQATDVGLVSYTVYIFMHMLTYNYIHTYA